MEFIKWRSINKFSDVYQYVNKSGKYEMYLRPKIKLHGTNAGIYCSSTGQLGAQKRTSFITPEDDNCGFARFVSTLHFKGTREDYIIYGEWAGPGIQNSDAVSSIPEKTFFVFSVLNVKTGYMSTQPSTISKIVINLFGEHDRIKVIPWYSSAIPLNFLDQKECQEFIDGATNEVDNIIGAEDPYIKEEFGIEGPGEGLVYYAFTYDNDSMKIIVPRMSCIFKVKTEIHTVNKAKKRNHVAPERPSGVDEFIDMFFTEARFNQMLNEIGGEASSTRTGEFLKAVMSDVYKESTNEIELAPFEWKDVPKYAMPTVKKWWFDKCVTI